MPDTIDMEKTTYSSGELASACGVSIRTVQYYDERGILPPSELGEGGRRIYVEADVAKLRKIILLKSLGLKLDTIRDFLDSTVSSRVLLDILREQDARLQRETEDLQAARASIALMIEGLETTGELPADTIPGMEGVMGKEKWYKGELRGMYWTMLVVGIILDALEIGSLAWWIATGNWWPFVIVMVFVIVICTVLVRMYRKRTAYRCAHCHEVFVPRLRDWMFSRHTLTTRKVRCTACGEKDWCAEISIESIDRHDR